jgi:hypothetical protein
MKLTPAEFADWLDAEAQRVHDIRWELHGGTKHPRLDLEGWADALKWAARKAREHMRVEVSPECECCNNDSTGAFDYDY